MNMVNGILRGSFADAQATPSSSSIEPSSYNLTSGTTVRKILASGANLDTEVVPISQTDDPGSPTEL
jgi:hypothetical protein